MNCPLIIRPRDVFSRSPTSKCSNCRSGTDNLNLSALEFVTRYESDPPDKPNTPPALGSIADPSPDPPISLIGDPALLDRKPIALFCSVHCPGDLILKSYDLARTLRANSVTLIGGFQSPIEKGVPRTPPESAYIPSHLRAASNHSPSIKSLQIAIQTIPAYTVVH